MDVSDVQLKVLTLSRQFIAKIGTFEATRFFCCSFLSFLSSIAVFTVCM